MAKQPELDILFFRSGPSDWDEAGRLQGRTDLPLSASAQAALPDTVSDLIGTGEGRVMPKWVLASPDEASVRLAEAFGARSGAKVRIVEGIAGLQCGLWEGRLRSELDERSPKAYRQWLADPVSASPPEGEPLPEAQHRVMGALARAFDKVAQGPVIVVLRPNPMGLVRSTLEGLPLSALWETLDSTPRAWRTRVVRAAVKELTSALGTAEARS